MNDEGLVNHGPLGFMRLRVLRMSIPLTTDPSGGQFYGYSARYIERLQGQKKSIERLSAALHDALHEYLISPIEEALEQAAEKPPHPPRPTIEDLNAAQAELDSYMAQLAALEQLTDNMPEEIGQNFMDSQRPTIERALKPVQDRISRIQAALEEPEDSPWDGSHSVGTLCAQCARTFEDYRHSVAALKVALKAAGWGRDPDGDHICPSCFAASTNPQPATTAPAETSTTAETGSQTKGEGI